MDMLCVNIGKMEGETRGSNVLYHSVPFEFEMLLFLGNLISDLITEQLEDLAVSPGPRRTGSEREEPFPVTSKHLTQ